MSRTVAFIQARMSSSRFPGKVLQQLGGLAMIDYMATRARKARLLDDVVVVTSTDQSDDVLANTLQSRGLPVFRGDLNDVLRRYADAASAHDADEIVRLTGDCPLVDPALIDAVIGLRHSANVSYASNVDPPSFPDGLDVECFDRDLLQRACTMAERPSEREHVTLWMRGADCNCQRANLQSIADLSSLRLTIDYPDDLEVIRHIVSALPGDGNFDMYDILRVMAARSDLMALNQHLRNEGLAISLEKEQGHP